MLGTFGGALEVRKIDASDGRLNADARGEVENEDGVLVIRRIHVEFTLRAPENVRDIIARVHGFYADKCPIYRSIHRAIDITSSYVLIPAPAPETSSGNAG
jgi:uncharacterized OsmC-like protein